MKKKVLALFMMVFTAIMMIGCNKTGMSLLDEMQKIYTWEGVDSKADIVVEAQAGEDTIKFYGDVTSYMNMADKAMEGTITFKKLEAAGETIDLTKGESAIAPIKIICKGNQTYFSKSYIENILKLTGVEPSTSLQNVSSEYIGLEYAAADVSKEGMNKYIDLMKKFNIDLDITQTDRTYTMEISDEEFVQLASDFVTELFKSDLMKEAMLTTGEVTDADYAELQKELSTQMTALLPELKTMLKGSSAKVNYAFADDSYKGSVEANLAINVDGEKVNVKVITTAESKKVAKKDITLPADTKVYTMEEFQSLLVPNVAYLDETDLVVKGNTVYVPLKDTMNQLDIEVKYDSKTKATSVVIDGEATKVTTKVINGTSYVTPATLQKLGFNYSLDEEGYVMIEQLYK